MTDPSADPPTDLDVVDDVGGSEADHTLDADLSRLLRETTSRAGGTAAPRDLAAVKERGLRRRRRTRVRRAAAAAAAAVVVVAVVSVEVHDGGRTTTVSGTTAPVPLLPDAVVLPPDVERQLQALPDTAGRLTRGANLGYLDGPVTRWADVVECSAAQRQAGILIPALRGMDASGFTEVCASNARAEDAGEEFSVTASGARPTLYRFYLPQGVDLGQVTPGSAAAMGVSWTSITPLTEQEAAEGHEREGLPREDATSVARPQGDRAVVSPVLWSRGTEVSWTEQTGAGTFAAGATVAADPVTAVRATFDPHPCDSGFSITPARASGGALTARGALQDWLEGDDAADRPPQTGGQGAPRMGWVVVEEREDQRTFAAGDWRVTAHELSWSSWRVTGQGCASPSDPAPPA
ncbi:MAG: hypothetical protein PGN11_00190 [Quadrisphaera sp.]